MRVTAVVLGFLMGACAADTDAMEPAVMADLNGRWHLLIDKQNGDADVTVIELTQTDGMLVGHRCSNAICDQDAISGNVDGASVDVQWSTSHLHATVDSSGDRFSGTIESKVAGCVLCKTRVEGSREGLDAGNPFGL